MTALESTASARRPGVVFEELGAEAAVSVAEDECVTALEELWKEVEAAVVERLAEGEVFEPTIGAGYLVEVGWCGPH
jgi:hypothetical protein